MVDLRLPSMATNPLETFSHDDVDFFSSFLPLRLLIYSFRNHPGDGLNHLSSHYVDDVCTYRREQTKKKVRKQRPNVPVTWLPHRAPPRYNIRRALFSPLRLYDAFSSLVQYCRVVLSLSNYSCPSPTAKSSRRTKNIRRVFEIAAHKSG